MVRLGLTGGGDWELLKGSLGELLGVTGCLVGGYWELEVLLVGLSGSWKG